MINLKEDFIKKYQIHCKDTGSSEIQIAILTYRINYLTKHFQNNQKDHHSRMGLIKIISQRKKLLKYLKRTNLTNYQNLTIKLKIRK
jgi:small subunit ribosomal protein S15